jgi:hypothetical protein
VGNRSICISITFPAMRVISIKTPAVVQAVGLGFCFLDKSLAQSFEMLNLSAVNVEIRDDGAASVIGSHKSSFVNLG